MQELLEQLSDKLDHSAREEIDKLDVHQALNILSDIDSQADAIRNPSAFVMSAARRQGSAGSRSRRDPPRLQEGPYADRSSYNDRGYADRDSYDSHYRDSDRSNGYGRQDYNSYSQNNGYAESRYPRRRDDNSYHQGYGRSEHQKVEQLLQYLDIDESAKEALSTIPVENQVELLEELTEDRSRVRKHSAFIVSNVKRVKEGTYRSRAPKDNGDGYSHNDFREYNSRRDRHYDYTSYQDEAEVANSPHDSFAWSALDEKAQALILGLSSEDAAAMVDDLEKKFHNLRNPSAFVASMVTKRYPRAGGQDTSSYDPPARSRSPRGHRQAIGASTEGPRPSSKQTASKSYQDYGYEANDQCMAPRSAEEAEQQRLQVADYVKNGLQGEVVLDNKAKDELLRIPPHEAISLMLKLTANDIRNPSAFVTKACREILKHVDSDPYAKQAANGHDAEGPGSNEQSQSRRPPARKQAAYGDNAEWRSMPLDQWLRSVDHGKGFLLQYEQALQSNYDTLEQIMDLYVTTGDDGRATIDQQFFSDLSVEKVGHRRLFEKWFNENRDELL